MPSKETVIKCYEAPTLYCPKGSAQFKVTNILRIQLTYDGEDYDISFGESGKDWYTDLASVPRDAWIIIPPHRKVKIAAIYHDGFYLFRPFIKPGIRMHKDMADDILEALCIAEGVGEPGSGIIYRAVHLFGDPVWDAHNLYFATNESLNNPFAPDPEAYLSV